ncbi:MAG TPA: TauD/TfdA family dioxygenase [Pyrinomonadaceae bacterium]|jgi:alpha-ketoglutarate-dependent taurine dioxygenase
MALLDKKEPFSIKADYIRISRGVLTKIQRLTTKYDNFEKLPCTFFREFVKKELSELFVLSSKIRSLLEKEHRFIIVNKLPFIRYKPEVRNFLFLSLASCIGRPTATDQNERKIIWEVTSRTYLPKGQMPTVTEHRLKAELHTDTSYKRKPEKYVALFVVRPAKDRGGLSQILDGRHFVDNIAKGKQGEECLKALRSLLFPFRVPTSFTKTRKEEEPETILATVISNTPLIRFRYDTIMDGFKCLPSYATKDALWAVNYFHKALEDSLKLTFRLNSGEVLFTNNHEILHGRTAFGDERRLLLRIRMEALP